jgi:hypothetical protein
MAQHAGSLVLRLDPFLLRGNPLLDCTELAI